MPDRLDQHYDPVDVVLRDYFAGASTFSALGEQTLYQPPAGKQMLLQYLCLSADAANAGAVNAHIYWRDSPTLLFKLSLKPGAIWARNIGAGKRCLRGNIEEPLMMILSSALPVHVSLEYEDL